MNKVEDVIYITLIQSAGTISTIVLVFTRIAAVSATEITLFRDAEDKHIRLGHNRKRGKRGERPNITIICHDSRHYFSRLSQIRVYVMSGRFYKHSLMSTMIVTATLMAKASDLACRQTHGNNGFFLFVFSNPVDIQLRQQITGRIWLVDLFIHILFNCY